jgi:hypothetical protein
MKTVIVNGGVKVTNVCELTLGVEVAFDCRFSRGWWCTSLCEAMELFADWFLACSCLHLQLEPVTPSPVFAFVLGVEERTTAQKLGP